jgi:hypothetical protein
MTTPKTVDAKTGQVTYGSSMPTGNADQVQDKPSAGSLPWGVLNQRHDCYDAEKNQKLLLLLHGGFEITKPDNAKLFIKRWNSERLQAYEDRIKAASYENNFGEIINDFGATIFSKPVMVVPETDSDDPTTPGQDVEDDPDPNEDWMLLQSHFDLENNTLAQFMKVQQTQSNALGCSYFGMDFEDGQPYAYPIDINSVLDYQKDDAGEFIFIVFRNDICQRTNIRQIRNLVTTQFIVWTRQDQSITMDMYQISWPKGKEPSEETPVSLIDSKVMSDFSLIPIVECETPNSLCVGNTIGQMAGSYFERYTTLLHALNRSSNPILSFQQGPELPANGDLSTINDNDNRGKQTLGTARASGGALIGPNDKLEWVEITGQSLKIFQEQLKDDKNEMYRLVSQLGSILASSYGAVGGSSGISKASGDSKQMDHVSKEAMLTAYAELVKKWILKAFNLVFSKEKELMFKCKGMDNYQVVDDAVLLQQVGNIPIYRENVPSPTSLKEMLLDIANRTHPFTNPGTLKKIRSEIFDAVDKMDLDSLHQATVQGAVQEKTQTDVNGKPTSGPDSKPKPSPKPSVGGSSPKANSPGGSDAMPTSTAALPGHSSEIDPATMHDRNASTAGVAQSVMDLLKPDYDKKLLQWIPAAHWVQMDVPLENIDDSNRADWEATKDQTKVESMSDAMKEGWSKPIVLVNEPNANKLVLVDGHHRFLAAEQNGEETINAFVAYVGGINGPWKEMHDLQGQGAAGGKSKQSKQKSQQKE